ncbi:MAG: serine O-acetyltransferase EpsC [Bacillota bacterium]|nr:serine O-acetyltransferase EpsC [Bacillota bacterium]
MKKKSILSDVISQMTYTYENEKLFNGRCNRHMPSKNAVIKIINELRNVIFPGYFSDDMILSEEYYTGYNILHVYDDLKRQIKAALSYFCFEGDISARAEEICLELFEQLPNIQQLLLKDVQAGFDGDPAAKSKEEIIFSYPGLFAIFVYRLAHPLYESNVPLIPRIMTEYAHSLTGIDINSGATIGEYFFIDHGTGVVIGETTSIGNNVKLYQGVTLGALSTRSGQKLAGTKRHPTICDNVTIYSGATVLGGETIIGEGVIVGGNCFITESVPAHTKVSAKNPELILKEQREMQKNDEKWEI